MSRIQSGHVHKVTLSSTIRVDNHDVLREAHFFRIFFVFYSRFLQSFETADSLNSRYIEFSIEIFQSRSCYNAGYLYHREISHHFS